MGIRPTKIIAIDGAAASLILSSAAYMYVDTARVSKLNGLNISVAGSSLTTSEMKLRKCKRKYLLGFLFLSFSFLLLLLLVSAYIGVARIACSSYNNGTSLEKQQLKLYNKWT